MLVYKATALIVAVVVSLFIILRLKNPFWAKQHVYHYWDAHLWLTSGKILSDGPPISNSYVDPLHVQTTPCADVSDVVKDQVVDLIRADYLRSEEVNYVPSTSDVFEYLQGHQSLISRWGEGDIRGVLTSRSLDAKLPIIGDKVVGYVDNLTVKKSFRKKGIAPRLIQTYLFQSRRINKDVNVYFFKREGETNPTVPAVRYSAEFYKRNDFGLPGKNGVQLLEEREMVFVLEALHRERQKSKIAVTMPDSDLLRLVKSNKIYIIKYSTTQGKLRGMMLVRKVPSFDKHDTPLLEVFCVLSNTQAPCSGKEFKMLLTGLSLIEPVSNLSIERIGSLALPTYNIEAVPDQVCPMAYFFYNYACQTLDSSECLVLL